MRRPVYLLVLTVCLCLPATVFAQVPDADNPSTVQFTASADHATIDGYELDILRPDGTVLQTLNLGKPAPDATQTCAAPINVQPIAFGVGYAMQLRAKAGTAVSANALSVNKFSRVPGAPSKLIAKEPEPVLEVNF